MASDDKAWEWDVATVGEVSSVLPLPLLSAGAIGFHFQSRLSNYAAVYVLVNVCIGPSFSLKKFKNMGTILEKVAKAEGKTFGLIGDHPHSRIYAKNAFSGDDLDLSIGQTLCGGIALPIGGYSLAVISANHIGWPFENYFHLQNVSGPEAGLDASAGIKTGLWIRAYETVYTPIS